MHDIAYRIVNEYRDIVFNQLELRNTMYTLCNYDTKWQDRFFLLFKPIVTTMCSNESSADDFTWF